MPEKDGSPTRSDGTQSIRRALAILDALAIGRDRGVRLVDVTRRTGLSRPTAHRILRVLVEDRHRAQRLGELGRLSVRRRPHEALLGLVAQEGVAQRAQVQRILPRDRAAP